MNTMPIPESTISSSLPQIQTVWVKNGYALGPEGSLLRLTRPLRIEIEGVRLLSPAQISDLMQSRISLEEVKILIRKVFRVAYRTIGLWETRRITSKQFWRTLRIYLMKHAQIVVDVLYTSDLLVRFYGMNAQSVDTSSIRLGETDLDRR